MQRKSRPKAASRFKSDDRGLAAIDTGFDFLRCAMKPMPAKPGIIIADVEGSVPAASVTTIRSACSTCRPEKLIRLAAHLRDLFAAVRRSSVSTA
jgi:hypothetical protein